MNIEERFHLVALRGTVQMVIFTARGFDLYKSVGIKEVIHPICFCCCSFPVSEWLLLPSEEQRRGVHYLELLAPGGCLNAYFQEN